MQRAVTRSDWDHVGLVRLYFHCTSYGYTYYEEPLGPRRPGAYTLAIPSTAVLTMWCGWWCIWVVSPISNLPMPPGGASRLRWVRVQRGRSQEARWPHRVRPHRVYPNPQPNPKPNPDPNPNQVRHHRV
eukprot:scaffold37504_cov58-Phaeocystis_antarctica.AAC.6